MRQKELRLALVCYGGISLAVYMHGITKEIWHLARASRAFHHPGETRLDGVAEAYRAFLGEIEQAQGFRLRVLPDVLTGASAGGINAVFLAQAIHSGHSLEPLTDVAAEQMLIDALDDSPKTLRRRILLTYLGFPFYDVATLPLTRREGLDEYNPVRIDRISPDDARSIRDGGTAATLRGIEFYNFGAFFSRDYRENDYLWGRLHGAERMIDLLASTANGGMPAERLRAAKRAVFLAVLE